MQYKLRGGQRRLIKGNFTSRKHNEGKEKGFDNGRKRKIYVGGDASGWPPFDVPSQ